MPESKTTPAPEEKKNDAPVTATPKSPEQKQPAPAQAGAAPTNPKQPESKPKDPPKEPHKVSPAPPTTPPPPPKAAPLTQAEDKDKGNPEKKPEPPKQAAPEVKKPEDKDGKGKAAEDPKKEQPGKAEVPKTAPAAEPMKPDEKATPGDTAKGAATDPKKSEQAPPAADPKGKAPADPKQPEVKTPAAEPKDKIADAPKSDETKAPIKVDGKGKVEIPIEPKGKAEDPKAAPAADPKKKDAAVEPPKGVKITKVYADRLDKPTQADLEKLPIPKEGEGFSMRLHPAYFFEFLNHPFSVNRETDDYRELYDSIKENGINEPIKARPREGGGLELISGHRRHDVAMQLNYPVPVVIVQADDDSAQIEVVDGNLHRQDIPTSELARAAKMKIEAMSRKVGRRSKMEKLTSPQKRTDQIVAEEMGYSRTQLTRLVRIDSLVPEMKQMVDSKKLPFNVAVELSYMTTQEQRDLVGVMQKEQTVPSLAQALQMKEASQKAAKAAKEAAKAPVPPPQVVTAAPEKTDAPPKQAPGIVPNGTDPKAAPATLVHIVPSTPIPTPPPAEKPPAPVDAKKFASIMKNKPEPELKVTFTGAELKDFFPGRTLSVPEVKRTVFEALDMRKKALEKQAKKQDIKNPAR